MTEGRRGRGVSARRVIRAFRKLGFEVDHVTGSHYILLHADGRRTSIPRHQTVKTGLLLAQLKRTGLTWEEFREALMSSYDYLIIVHPDEDDGGFWTEVPALPGCGSQGETLELAVEMTKDAIQGFIGSMKKHGEVPPTERTVAIKVTVAA